LGNFAVFAGEVKTANIERSK